MARLNEPPAPTPSSPSSASTALEVLKRRFTRQNRDLARTNSAQSLRIRNLEKEISILLAENIRLREESHRAHEEADRLRVGGGEGLLRDVGRLKGELERKLEEVGILVGELGKLPEKAAKERRHNQEARRKRDRDSLGASEGVTSPDQRDWRTRQTITGVLHSRPDRAADDEGRLPVILEGKLYPRRTLEPPEIETLRNADQQAGNESGSPELGPPPVARFEDEERGSWGAVREQESLDDKELTLLEGDVLQLPSNLETRRKRRTSSLLSDMTPAQDECEGDAQGQESKPALFKSGAKRKLDLAELEVPREAIGTTEDDFVFQRRPAFKPTSSRKSGRFAKGMGQQAGEVIIPTTASSSPRKEVEGKERKVLAEKSTNSPSKRAVLADGKDDKDEKGDWREDRDPRITSVRSADSSTRSRRQQPPSEPSQTHPPTSEPESNHDSLPPTTPFIPNDILSPPSTSTSTDPSTKHKATIPSEAAITSSVEDILNGSIGRVSRRARVAVNYAQPNLRDKMRRPGRELVGAVEGIDKRVREGSIDADMRRSQNEHVSGDGVDGKQQRVKTEEGLEDAKWKKLPVAEVRMGKAEPTSPLSDKKQSSDEGRNEARRHERKQSTINVVGNGDDNVESLEQDVRRLSIFDPPSSSPVQPPTIPVDSTAHKDTEKETGSSDTRRQLPSSSSTSSLARASRSIAASRRHSMAPSASTNLTRSSTAPAPGRAGSLTSSRDRPSSAASNRSDRDGGSGGVSGLKSSSSTTAGGGMGRSAGLRALSTVDQKENMVGLASKKDDDDAGRSRRERERGLARRRSMMI